jgi:hypothetical protein
MNVYRYGKLGLIGVGIVLPGLIACSPISIVPNLFTVRVLPGPDRTTDFTVNLGQPLRVEFEVTMGVNVEASELELRLLNKPFQLLQDSLDGVYEINDLGAQETGLLVYAADTFTFDDPGEFTITAEVCGKIRETGFDESSEVDDCEQVTFSVFLVDPNAPADKPDDDMQKGPDTPTSATCAQYVAHYNSLPCTSDALELSNTCSESISENCSGEDAFNACRIENTFCDDTGQLVQTLDGCFELLDCS